MSSEASAIYQAPTVLVPAVAAALAAAGFDISKVGPPPGLEAPPAQPWTP
eukprot:CAMPEP_0168490320 /NCGR_PEP_ID=MMETSP0228-20121227/69123_1 /TAXON_ID=133427 /ORGANISM="Protoceratium reticulatum, Strain CCCM 535 (=CCMP 1889)" /LENGTH=49 /DNA_ID= /DNA_START= /DNA_END= /DNA_ORIENTATION=